MTSQNYSLLLTKNVWSGWKASFNDSNLSVLPTSTVDTSYSVSINKTGGFHLDERNPIFRMGLLVAIVNHTKNELFDSQL